MIISLNKFEKKGKPEDKFDVQPTTSDQFIEPTEGYVFSRGIVRAVTSDIDVNIQPENIKQGVSILSVEGTLKEEKPEEIFNIQPTITDQAITPTEGSVFISGTVRAVTSSIDNNIQPENIKQGVSILGVEGTLTEGAGGDTPNYRYMNGTIDKAGLKEIGWTDEDILTYEQNTPHYTWQNDQYIVSEENKALYSLEDPNPSSYKDNPNITFVPKKNMESYFAKSHGFSNLKYIKGIPFYDTSNVTSMVGMFNSCHNLATIPELDTSNVTTMEFMFDNCYRLTTIPQLNTSNVTSMYTMFRTCSNLTTIPLLDTSNVTSMSNMFRNCTRFTTIPELDTSKVTNMVSMFQECSNLTTIPQLNTSNVTNMYSMFNGCTSLTSIPQLDTSNVTNMNSMFKGCSNLTTIPQLDTSKVTSIQHMLSDCKNLAVVEGIDFSGLTSNLTNLFGYTSKMSKLTRFIVNGKINVSISDDYSIKALTAIDYDSVKSILAAADRTDNTNAKTLAFNRTMTDQNGELAALVTSCTSKGWIITGLTIE